MASFLGKLSPRKSSREKDSNPASKIMAASLSSMPSMYGTLTLKPMSEKHRETLRASRIHLVKDLDVSEIMDYMIQHGVIDDEKSNIILSKQTRQERTRTFLDILGRSHENAFDIFLESLDRSSPHLADILRRTLEVISEPMYYLSTVEGENEGCPYHDIYKSKDSSNLSDDRFTESAATDVKSTNHQPLDATNNHQSVQFNQASVSTFPSKASYIDPADIEEKRDNHQSVQFNQASVSTFPSDASYIDDIVKKISDIVCYQSTGTQSLVCKSNCEAYILSEGVGISSPQDPDVSPKRVFMAAGECLFIDLALKIEFEQRDNKVSYIRVWDGKGRLLSVPAWAVKIFGDPCGEPWFHPVPLSAAQANMILTPYQKPGVFLVYIPQQSYENSEVKFNLSVCVRKGNGLKTMHYHVKGLNGGRVQLSADEQDYTCIQKLIAHFKNNKGCLPCRLRMSPKEVGRKVLPGENYEMKWYIRENALKFSDDYVQGTYGNVLQATLGNLPVAVKYQSIYHKDDPWAFENFLEEAKILSELDHRNIVQLQGFCFNSDEKPYIVMEFLFGGSLQQAIKNKMDKSVEKVTMLFKQVLFALRYLENKSYMIHRRVAACNFLMGESECLKLVDFGLARTVSQDCFTNGDHDKISVRWSAPEVLSKGQFSTKSDVWSAGVVLWEILSDGFEKPYGSLTSEEISEIVVNKDGRLCCPNRIDASMKDIFKVVTTRCWRGSVSERASASDLLDVISARLNSHKGSMSQAALSQGLYLPDFQYMTERQMKMKKMPKNLGRQLGNGYEYAHEGPRF